MDEAAPKGPRVCCTDHIRYTVGCPPCKVAHRAYEVWRYPPAEPDGRWALAVTGPFAGGAVRRHIMLALDEATAYRRAEWWRQYRSDVRVEVLTRPGEGQAWVVVDELAVAE